MGILPMSPPIGLALFVHRHLPLRPRPVPIGFVWRIRRARRRAVLRSMGHLAHVPAHRIGFVCSQTLPAPAPARPHWVRLAHSPYPPPGRLPRHGRERPCPSPPEGNWVRLYNSLVPIRPGPAGDWLCFAGALPVCNSSQLLVGTGLIPQTALAPIGFVWHDLPHLGGTRRPGRACCFRPAGRELGSFDIIWRERLFRLRLCAHVSLCSFPAGKTRVLRPDGAQRPPRAAAPIYRCFALHVCCTTKQHSGRNIPRGPTPLQSALSC